MLLGSKTTLRNLYQRQIFKKIMTVFVVRVEESVIVHLKGYLLVIILIQKLLSFWAIWGGVEFCFSLGML